MNWITQAAFGAMLGERMLGKRLGKTALAWGALIGLLPEFLELPPFILLNSARALAWVDGISHSLPVMALLAWGTTEGLARLWKRFKIPKAEAAWFVAAVWSGHLLLDCLSPTGVPVFWPVSGERVAFNLLGSWDLLFLAPLLITSVWLALLPEEKPAKKSRSKKPKPPPPSKRRKLFHRGLGLAGGYLLLAAGTKFVASRGFDGDLARRGTKFARRMEGPVSGNILLHRAVVEQDTEFRVGYRCIFESSSTPVRWTIYPKGREALDKVKDLPAAKTLLAYTDGWWIARPDAQGAWLGDLRLPETRVWGARKTMVDSRITAAWLILPAEKSNQLRRILPANGDAMDYLKRMALRTFGAHTEWEANPRLAGVPGSLPEFLPVQE